MSRDANTAFIEHLQHLAQRDRGALAALRRSLSFAPGDYPKAYPYVERYVGRDWHAADARRRALYAVAGLYAMHPVAHARSLAAAMGQLVRDKDRPSLELRFVALLEADADGVMNHLRQAVSLLAAEGMGFNHAMLLQDLNVALNERASPDARDRLKRQWAREFYRSLQPDHDAEGAAPAPAAASATTQ